MKQPWMEIMARSLQKTSDQKKWLIQLAKGARWYYFELPDLIHGKNEYRMEIPEKFSHPLYFEMYTPKTAHITLGVPVILHWLAVNLPEKERLGALERASKEFFWSSQVPLVLECLYMMRQIILEYKRPILDPNVKVFPIRCCRHDKIIRNLNEFEFWCLACKKRNKRYFSPKGSICGGYPPSNKGGDQNAKMAKIGSLAVQAVQKGLAISQSKID